MNWASAIAHTLYSQSDRDITADAPVAAADGFRRKALKQNSFYYSGAKRWQNMILGFI
jgi:hypothetical protein